MSEYKSAFNKDGSFKTSRITAGSKAKKVITAADITLGNERNQTRLAAAGAPVDLKHDPGFWEKLFGVLHAPASGVQSLLHNAINPATDADVNPLGEMWKSVQGKEAMQFGDITTDLGWKPTDTLGKVGKFGFDFMGEMLTDPMSLVGAGEGSIARNAFDSAITAIGKVGLSVDDVAKFAKYVPEIATKYSELKTGADAVNAAGHLILNATNKPFQTLVKKAIRADIANETGDLGGLVLRLRHGQKGISVIPRTAVEGAVGAVQKVPVVGDVLGGAVRGVRAAAAPFSGAIHNIDTLGDIAGPQATEVARSSRAYLNWGRSAARDEELALQRILPKRTQGLAAQVVDSFSRDDGIRAALRDAKRGATGRKKAMSDLLQRAGVKASDFKSGDYDALVDAALTKWDEYASTVDYTKASLRGAKRDVKGGMDWLKKGQGKTEKVADAIDQSFIGTTRDPLSIHTVEAPNEASRSVLSAAQESRKAEATANAELLWGGQDGAIGVKDMAANLGFKVSEGKTKNLTSFISWLSKEAEAGRISPDYAGVVRQYMDAVKTLNKFREGMPAVGSGISRLIPSQTKSLSEEIASLAAKASRGSAKVKGIESAVTRYMNYDGLATDAGAVASDLMGSERIGVWDEVGRELSRRFAVANPDAAPLTAEEIAGAIEGMKLHSANQAESLAVENALGRGVGNRGSFYVQHAPGNAGDEAMRSVGLEPGSIPAYDQVTTPLGKGGTKATAAQKRSINTLDERLAKGIPTNTDLASIDKARRYEREAFVNKTIVDQKYSFSGAPITDKAYEAMGSRDKNLVRVLGDKRYKFDASTAQAYDELMGPLTDPATAKVVSKNLSTVTAMWKRLATASPGFVARNMYSNYYFGWSHGYGNLKDWGEGIRVGLSNSADDMITFVADGVPKTMNTLEFKDMLRKLGGIGGGQEAEVIWDLEKAKNVPHFLSGGLAADAVHAANSGAEDASRIAVFLQATKKGMSVDQAVREVNKVLFDYGDLTATEKGIKNLVPFWAFIRNNLPEQLRVLATDPSKIGVFGKLRAAGETSNGGKPIDYSLLPEYMQQMAPIQLPFGGKTPLMLNPNFGFQDLEKLSGIADLAHGDVGPLVREFMASVNPIFKIPIEVGLNTDSYFQGRVVDHVGQITKAPSYMQAMDSTFKGQKWWEVIKKFTGSETIDGTLKVSPLMLKYLSANPLLTNMGKMLEPGPQQLARVASWVAGIKAMPYEEDKLKTDRAYSDQSAIRDAMKAAKDRGKTVPTMKELGLTTKQVSTGRITDLSKLKGSNRVTTGR